VLDSTVRDLAQGKNFGAFTFHLPSGDMSTHIMWVDADDDHVLINTEVERAKAKAVDKDPQVTVTIWDQASPYRYAEVRGRVVETDSSPTARAHIDELSRKYTGADYAGEIKSDRVILRIEPTRVRTWGL
jgi:PPOX class probable F420-dependent enzyme